MDAGRSLLYCCARYVDIYKALEDIARDTKLTPEERQEMKKYTRLADAFTPLAKGMNSEYANQNAYDAISIHGGSGFIMEYKCQRLFRDARIFSIYEGTTQLQVVAAIRYITNGTYLSIIKEMLENEVSDDLKALKERVAKLVELYEAAINKVKEANDQAVHDFLARRLYNMTGDIVMSLLILDDATKAPEMFQIGALDGVGGADAVCLVLVVDGQVGQMGLETPVRRTVHTGRGESTVHAQLSLASRSHCKASSCWYGRSSMAPPPRP